jgi:hypothetical protein
VPWWLESDTFADEPVWELLAKGNTDLEDRLQAAYCRLKAKAALVRRDGYLAAQKALEACRGRRRILDLLCTPVLDQPPLLHRKGDVCDCLAGDWITGYEYRIHAFLKKNPARMENDRDRAMKADRADARLRALVIARDAGCCRYCRSGPLSPKTNNRTLDRRKIVSLDHVDPDRPATPDGGNFVMACARCNEQKAHCTPAEADMVLLPEPTERERAVWSARPQMLFDLPTDHPRIIAASSPDHSSISDAADDAITDRPDDRPHDAVADAGGVVRPDPAGHDHDQPREQLRKGPGPGRGAAISVPGHDPPPPRRAPGAQPARTSDSPDIYTRRSRPDPDPGYSGWPPGSFPADPRPREDDP